MNPPPNYRAALDAALASSLHFRRHWRRASLEMKALILLSGWLALTWFSTTALGDSFDMPLPKKVRSLPVVVEVRIKRLEVRPDPPNKFEDLLCDCEVLQAFKLPFATNRLILRMNFAAAEGEYEGKKAVVFASESQYGHFSPFGGKLGFILESEKYHDRYSRKEIDYVELIREVKGIVEANQQGGANRSQPVRSETNRTSSAANSGR